MVNFDDIILESGQVSFDDMERAQNVAAQTDSSLLNVLPQLGLINEETLSRLIADHLDLPIAEAADFPEELLGLDDMNAQWMYRHSVLPLNKANDVLDVAMLNPSDTELMKAIRFASDCEVKPRVAKASDIADWYDNIGINQYDMLDDTDDNKSDIERMLDSASEAPIIRLVNNLLDRAAKKGASDIHIEPMAQYVTVRFRIDGRLAEVEKHPVATAPSIASRIKVMAALDISESRLPQDGRIGFTHRGEKIDVRVSTSPISNGESIVMRLLGRSHLPLDLEQIGLPPKIVAKLIRILERPHGMILVTGPTGSGKTTTLYAGLNRLSKPDVKILTVEDPVEILLEGVNQVQVRPDIGLDYAGTLRAFLRQDPDILMIGEIRDRDTADIALRASLTGHLVLSTLHTNTAIGAFTRLNDIGIEDYLSASTVIASIAQRLVRTLCPDCKVARKPHQDEIKLFEKIGQDIPKQIFDAKGCQSCSMSGYNGRTPIMEIIEVDEELRTLINEGRANEKKLTPAEQLSGQALNMVANGKTSMAEAMRVTGSS